LKCKVIEAAVNEDRDPGPLSHREVRESTDQGPVSGINIKDNHIFTPHSAKNIKHSLKAFQFNWIHKSRHPFLISWSKRDPGKVGVRKP
jgi:hypothetical protein